MNQNKIKLTPKGEAFMNYLEAKNNGSQNYIEEYENTMIKIEKEIKSGIENTLKLYFKKNPDAKIVKVKVLKDIPEFAVMQGDIIEILDKPIYKGFNLFNKIGFNKKYYLAGKMIGWTIGSKNIEFLTSASRDFSRE